jgi:SAM-dependent methyltransferase
MREVKDFYKNTPFNYTDDVSFFTKSIKNNNQILEYEDLHKMLRARFNLTGKNKINSIIEFGCGTGWLSNSLSYYYGKDVLGIDFTEKAINKAKAVSNDLNLNSEFKLSNLFEYQSNLKYDLVISLGVLHHTEDCKAAFKHISKFVKPGGFLYVGLYHLYGRRPMLRFLKNYARWHGDLSAFNLFKKMRRDIDSDQHNYSWFRDQVLHPHETQHTLMEVNDWLNEISFSLVSTSINKYKTLNNYNLSALDKAERELEQISFNRNIEELIFSPGYFTICAENK